MGSDTEVSARNAKPNVRNYICDYEDCFLSFNRPSKLVRHIRSHTQERPYKCDHPNCGKSYTNNSHLRRHVLTAHKKTNIPVVYLNCPQPGCMVQCQNKYSLKKHFKSHSIYTYNCPDCGDKFKKKRQLVSHSYQHRGLPSFACMRCDQKFATERELTNHGRKHRVHVCEYVDCTEEFSTWSSLRKHFKQKHKRCYECDFCKRTFINKNTMTKHILNHLDVNNPKVYLCQHKGCLRYYKYKSNLRHHIKTAHEGKRFNCTEEGCKQVFKTKNRLNDHLTRHKNGTLNVPRVINRGKPRKTRKDKGLSTCSKAALLSGVILPPEANKCLARNAITPEVEANINETVELLRKAAEEEEEEEKEDLQNENAIETQTKDKDPSHSIMFIVDNRSFQCLK